MLLALDEPGTGAVLLGALGIFAVGRLVLSLLPAGRPGEASLGAWPLTWATSHALGCIVLAAQDRWLAPSDWLRPGPWLPWLALLLLRLVALPGAMVPRHPLRHEPPGPATRALRLAALVLVVLQVPRSAGAVAGVERVLLGAGPAAALGWAALLVLLDHGLRAARRAPLERALLGLAVAAGAAWLTPGPAPLAALAAGAFGVPWLRAADRRALALALLGWTALLPAHPPLALAGLAVVLAGPGLLRRRDATGGPALTPDGRAALRPSRSEGLLLLAAVAVGLAGLPWDPEGGRALARTLVPLAALALGLGLLRPERAPAL